MPQTEAMPHDGQLLCYLGPAEVLPSQQSTPEQVTDGSKRRAACDECRTLTWYLNDVSSPFANQHFLAGKRKLRCSGEPAGCTRCLKHQIQCQYSVQKPMGRPRKRQRQQDEEILQPQEDGWIAPDNDEDPSVSYDPEAVSHYPDMSPPNVTDLLVNESIHPHIYSSFMQSRSISARSPEALPLEHNPNATNTWSSDHLNGLEMDDTPPSEILSTPPNLNNMIDSWTGTVPGSGNVTDTSTWQPDYKDFNMPAIIESTALDSRSLPSESQSTPNTCACLSNLYLTLSSLSTLQSNNRAPGRPGASTPSIFPLVTPATIETLRMASREAYRVIHCCICPQSFQTGMQNIMLLCTLLSVLGDIWGRLSRAPVKDIRSGFITGTTNADSMSDEDWRALIRRIVRKGVYGRVEASTSSFHADIEDERYNRSYSLSYLINSLERRQKTWHGQVEDDGEFPDIKRHWTGTEGPRVKFGSVFSPNVGATGASSNGYGATVPNAGKNGGTEGCKGTVMQKNSEEGHLCLQIVDQVRGLMAALDLDDTNGGS